VTGERWHDVCALEDLVEGTGVGALVSRRQIAIFQVHGRVYALDNFDPASRANVLSRGLTGNAGIGHGNFFLERGVQTPEQIVAGIPNGFYVTELMGFGVNVVTGDYSRGAAGLWIRNGELAFAVSEVTIAGNLNDMLRNIEAIGSDLEFRGSVAAPTIKLGEMTVGGK